MAPNELDVFINCPFDDQYQSKFNAIVYTVIRSGYRARCAREADNAADSRIAKIMDIIGACRFGIHDISRTETGGDPPLPRFNMPLELGLFLGARRFGAKQQKAKSCIVFDREPFRYQKFISDIAGQDIHSHGDDVGAIIKELAAWLRLQPGGGRVPGGEAIRREYVEFESRLPAICAAQQLMVSELTFDDFSNLATEYVAALESERALAKEAPPPLP